MAYPIEDIGVPAGTLSGRRQVSQIFDRIRIKMNDRNGNTFDNTALLNRFNDIYSILNDFLLEIGSDLVRKDHQLVTVADQREYELPGDFLAWCQLPDGNAWLYKTDDNDRGLEQVDQRFVGHVNTTTGIPTDFYLRLHSTGITIIGLDPEPDAAYTFNGKYYPLVVDYTDVASYMPFASYLDQVFLEELEFWCRHWKEFTIDLSMQSKEQARLRAQGIISKRVLERKNVGPSTFRNFGGHDTVY